MAERQHPDERDVDAIFESIVARWDDPPAEEPTTGAPSGDTDRPRRQSTGDVHLPSSPDGASGDESPGDDEGGTPGDPSHEPEPVPWRTDPTNSVAEALLGDDDPGTAEEEGFTPDPPAPLPPASDRLFWGAMAGLVLGPLGLVWIALAQPGGFWPKAIVIGLIIAGFACLFLRQPTKRGYDPDQGARV